MTTVQHTASYHAVKSCRPAAAKTALKEITSKLLKINRNYYT